MIIMYFSIFFFFNNTATTEIYTLSLHDALPISQNQFSGIGRFRAFFDRIVVSEAWSTISNRIGTLYFCRRRSEEHTSELQSQSNLVCRLLLEKKKTKTI